MCDVVLFENDSFAKEKARLFTLRHDPASAREPGTASTTDALVAEFRPDEATKKVIRELLATKPVAEKELRSTDHE